MARLIVRGRYEQDPGAFKAIATAASTKPDVVAKIKTTADRVAGVARMSLSGASTRNAAQAKEKAEVLSGIRVITANSTFQRNKFAPGSTIEVFLAVAHHPATVRWEHGTKRTPATNFMQRGKAGAA